MDTTFIYFLRDPENPMKGYVGKTDKPRKRLAEHLKDKRARKCHRKHWLDSLTKRGLKPRLVIIDEVREPEGYPAEAAYIQFFQEEGYELVNSTPGGDCGPVMFGEKNPRYGKHHSSETRKAISETQSGENGFWFGKTGEKHPSFGIKTPPERCAKMRRKESTASSKFNGVYRRESGKWRAVIYFSGKRIGLGTFAGEVEAAEVYDIAAKIHHGAYAVLNFPD